MTEKRIEVLIGSPDDIPYVIDLGRRTVISSVSTQRPVPSEVVEISYLRMLDYAFSQNPVIFLARADDQPIGFLLYADFLPDDVTGQQQAFVAYMAVEDDMRRFGIAKRLIAAAESYARANGLTSITLMVTEQNEAARALYEEVGFTTERRLLCKNL